MVIIQNETAPLFQCQLLHVRNRKGEVRALFLLSFASLSASQSFTVRFIISLANTERKKEPNFRFWLAPLKSTTAITGTPLALILMGRVKLKIKRLESTNNRQVTYSKRRNGILKKARELSVLCDIDIILLMFSPNGKPTFFHGERSNVEEVIARFSQLTPQERAKRKLESLEALKKTFMKLDHDVNIQDFFSASNQTVEELTDQIRVMQDQLAEVHKRLSYWSNLDNIDSIEHLRQMEDSLGESINRIRLHKENIGKCQLLSLDYTTQFQNGSLPLMMSGLQEVQPLSWLPNNGNEHMLLSGEPSFMSHRDMECSTDVSLPGSSGYFSAGKQTEIGTSGSVDNMGQEGATLSELSSTGCLNLQVGDQFSCPYGNLSYTDDKKLKAPEMEMNLQGNHAVYQVNSNFEMPRPMYDNGHHNWVPTQGPCSVAMYNGNSYNPQSN